MTINNRENLFIWLNSLEVVGILFVLCVAFFFQFVLNELPCPLCLLQRIGLIGICVGLLLNLKFGVRPAHYSLVLLSALFTGFVALRQVALHVVPGTGEYGSAIFGLHFYTWSFVVSMCVVIYTTIVLSFSVQYREGYLKNTSWKTVRYILFFLTLAIVAANIVSVYLECGFKPCPEDPINYLIRW